MATNELDALAKELMQAEGLDTKTAQAEACAAFAELEAYARRWDRDALAAKQTAIIVEAIPLAAALQGLLIKLRQ